MVEGPNARICDCCVKRGANATDTDEGVLCTFCQATRASFIVDGTGICPDCVELSRRIILQARPADLPPARVVKR
jgi:hypothetical protein